MTLRFEQVAALLRQIDAAEGQDVEIQTGDWRIAVTAWPSRPAAPAPTRGQAAPVDSPQVAPAQPAVPAVVPLRCPAVGVFRPGTVQPGQTVASGDVLGTVEAYGGGNTDVIAEQGGRLLELIPGDGDFVHFAEVIGALDQR